MINHGQLQAQLQKAKDKLSIAFAEAGAAWGPTDGHYALPQAVQLEARIQIGEMYIRNHPHDAQAKRALLQLRNRYARALEDPGDRQRCARWQDAYNRFLKANERYLTLAKRAKTLGVEEGIE